MECRGPCVHGSVSPYSGGSAASVIASTQAATGGTLYITEDAGYSQSEAKISGRVFAKSRFWYGDHGRCPGVVGECGYIITST